MIAIDTNVLVRYLVRDDERQWKAAVAIVDAAIASEQGLFVSDIVICECVWVLHGAYRVQRSETVRVLKELLRARHLAFTSSDQLSRAIDSFASGNGDLADYLIREHARAVGCDTVVTFDKALFKERGFRPA